MKIAWFKKLEFGAELAGQVAKLARVYPAEPMRLRTKGGKKNELA